jgi:hypothetical protein
MINQNKYIILPPEKHRISRTVHQSEIEKALWILGVNYYRLTKEDEETILKLAKKF